MCWFWKLLNLVCFDCCRLLLWFVDFIAVWMLVYGVSGD